MSPTNQNDIAVFARTNFRGQMRPFGIKTDDRRRHTYIIGKTGMGKSTLLENLVIQDIRAGRGLALVDPHGDTVEKVIKYIPANRINDVVYFNPDDRDFPIAFNILEAVNPNQRHLVASGLMGVFTKIWEGVWSARMEYILNNSILALLEMPGSTLLGIPRLYVDKDYRRKVVSRLKDPIVKSFWTNEFENYPPQFRNEAVAPIQNKVGQFLSNAIIRNVVGQPKSSIDLREVMDSGKILLLNLAKGRIGEDNAALLGAMMITKLQLAAMSRIDIPEHDRQDFYLYVDEFQNFATESFANILSEARKYHLNLIIAHQYIEQLDEIVRPAVFGNVGTIICFRVGAADAEFLEKEFTPVFTETDLVNLTKFEMYLKLMIDGVASEPFSATGLPPITAQPEENNVDKVIKVSRERYAAAREEVEDKIARWTGAMEALEAKAQTEPRGRGPRREEEADEEPKVYERSAPVVRDDIPQPISLSQALQTNRSQGQSSGERRPESRQGQGGQPRRDDRRSGGPGRRDRHRSQEFRSQSGQPQPPRRDRERSSDQNAPRPPQATPPSHPTPAQVDEPTPHSQQSIPPPQPRSQPPTPPRSAPHPGHTMTPGQVVKLP